MLNLIIVVSVLLITYQTNVKMQVVQTARGRIVQVMKAGLVTVIVMMAPMVSILTVMNLIVMQVIVTAVTLVDTPILIVRGKAIILKPG